MALLVAGMALAGCAPDQARPGATEASATIVTAARPAGTPAARLIVSEFHGSFTVLFSVATADPADRRPLVRIEHAPNWAPRAAVAPGGGLIAYTVMAPGASAPDTDATLWVVSLEQREPRRLATRLDARVAPIWSPDGTRVVVQRVMVGAAGPIVALDQIDVRGGRSASLVEEASAGRIFPAGYAPDGARFYYVRFDRDGAYLHEVEPGTRAGRTVARLADGAARDFRISPDGTSLGYLAITGTPARYRAQAVDLHRGDVRALLPDVIRDEDVGVAWLPGAAAATLGMIVPGGETTGRIALDGAAPATLVQTIQGFDVPVAWSPDGRYLVVRSFAGHTADDPGAEQPALIDAEGMRRTLTGGGPIEFVGWTPDAP